MNILLQIENKLFIDSRIRLWGSGAIFAFIFTVLWQVSHHRWPILPNGHPKCIDFGFFWLSGKLAVAGDTARVFDYPAWSAFQSSFFDPGNCPNFNRFYYPPTLLFFTYPIALMPYLAAFVVWMLVSFALYLAAVYAIIPRRAALIAAAAPVSVMLSNVILGHSGFFTAAFIGLTLVFMERRPVLSGIFLGLLTYKPHFGPLFPIALLASRNWRALGSAVVTTVVLGVLAAMIFGFDGWVQFIDSLTDRTSGLGPAQGVQPRLHSIFGVLYMAGWSTTIAWSAQLLVSATVALGIGMLWTKPVSYNLKAAALCAGMLFVSPYAVGYDLFIVCIAIAFFVKEGLSRGFLQGERIVILGFWVLLFFLWLPLSLMVCAILLTLIARRIVVYRSNAEAFSHGALVSVGIGS